MRWAHEVLAVHRGMLVHEQRRCRKSEKIYYYQDPTNQCSPAPKAKPEVNSLQDPAPTWCVAEETE